MKNLGMCALSGVLALFITVSAAQGVDIVLDGLECYLDLTKDPNAANPGLVPDLTGNGNDGTLISNPDPDGGGPATGVPTFDGAGIRFFGGWMDVDPCGTLNTLSEGTLEIIYSNMPIIDNAISAGALLGVANPGNDAGGGRSDDWEIWVDHRTLVNRTGALSGRDGNAGVDEFITNIIHGMNLGDGSQREQYFAQWSGGQARLVGRFYVGGVLTTMASTWVSTGSMPAFLSEATNLRFGGRHYPNPLDAATEPPYYYTTGNVLRVYNRVLSDEEMEQNWNAYNGPIPIPQSCQDVIDGGLYLVSSDLNNDCYVNLADLGVFAGDWMRCVDPCDVACDHPWQ